MEVWVKIFESNGKQVLVEKGEDEDGNPQVLFRWPEDDFNVSIGPSWKGDSDRHFEVRDLYFEKINQEDIDAFVEGTRKKILEL